MSKPGISFEREDADGYGSSFSEDEEREEVLKKKKRKDLAQKTEPRKRKL